MKKNCALIVGLLCCGFIFTSFSPSLDGRAVVAEEGVMPKGVFARTVGYLPGDSISVTNLAKKATVDILVIGALDPSEGIAILLTPEAADLLGMDKKKNNVVKVTKRSGQLDETVSGTAVIGDVIDDDFDDEEVDSVEIAESTEGDGETPVVAVDEPEEESYEEEAYTPPESTEAIEYAYEPLPEEVEEEKHEEAVEADEYENASVAAVKEEPIFEKVEEDDDFAPEKTYVASEKVDEDDLAEYDFDRYETPDDEEALLVADTYEEEEEEEIEAVPDVYIETEGDEVASNSFNEDAPPEYVKVEEVGDGFDEAVSATLFEEVEEDEEIAYSPDPAPVSEPIEDDLEEYVATVEVLEEETEKNVESYDAIVLVPADPKTPEEPIEEEACEYDEDEMDEYVDEGTEEFVPSGTGIALEDVLDEGEETEDVDGEYGEEAIVLVPVTDEEIALAEESESKEEDEAQIIGKFPFDKYTVSDLKSLESGKYYVQIAIYNDDVNIQNVLDKYSENYPITLVPLSSGKASQVMVGPLNVDEYGTVLNRFKSYGYKDAFLRKIR